MALLKLSKPPGALVVLVQALTTGAAAAATGAGMSASQALASQPGPSTQAALATAAAASGEGLGPEAAGISGHAWVCLGKLCLVDEGLAKKAAPLFVQVGRMCRVWWILLLSHGVCRTVPGCCCNHVRRRSWVKGAYKAAATLTHKLCPGPCPRRSCRARLRLWCATTA